MSTVRSATFDILRRFGVDHVFGNPGSTELAFLDRWPNDIRYVLGLQEASVVAMADGFAQATGRAAFVNLHSAAGVGHALGNVYTAFRNQAPLVITAGQQARSLLPMHPFLFAEQATEFPKPYVKWSVEPARAADVPAAIAQAFHVAMQAPRGPTFVSVPSDDWAQPAQTPRARTVATVAAADPDLLRDMGAALDAAARPALVVGPQVDAEDCWDETVDLAEALQAAVWIAPFASRACFPESHPLFQGFLPAAPQAVSAALAKNDVVAVLGAPVFTFHVAGECALFERDVALFQIVDDPAAAARAAIGASLVGSLRLSLPALRAAIAERPRAAPPSREPPAAPLAATPLRADWLMARLAALRPPGAVVVEEAPSHRPAMQAHLPFATPRSFFTMASGGLGYSLPAAVGHALARPDRRTICLIGDGSAMYSVQALWTAVQHGLPLTVVVVNNAGYGAMRSFSKTLGVAGAPGVDLPGLDFVALAAGMGCPARRATRPDELEDALRGALAADGPSLVEAVVDGAVAHLYDKAG